MIEKTWIEHIRNGDTEALDSFIRYYYPQIYSYVRTRVKRQDAAADITQEVFLRFTQNIDTFEFRGKTKQYLLKVAISRCNSWYRQQREVELKEETELVSCDTVSYDRERLLHCLDRLPNEQKEVLILKYFEQLKFREIAELLSLSESTVKTRVRLGLKKLKNIMKKEDWL